MIKLIDILKEIGDSSAQPYKFDFYGDYGGDRIYGFDTENYPYTVELRYEDFDNYDEDYEDFDNYDEDITNVLGIRFYVSDDDDDPDIEQDSIVTNKGELFKVMATVTAIVKKDIQNHPEIDTLTFTPAKKEGETSNVSRLNLYTRYIKHEFPNATIKPIDNRGTVEVKLK